MNSATKGRRIEHEIVHELEAVGAWPVLRSAGSKGVADIVAFLNGRTIAVQAKANCWPAPAERRALAQLRSATGWDVYAVRRDDGKKALRWARVTEDGEVVE